jgi:hypothetical protein
LDPTAKAAAIIAGCIVLVLFVAGVGSAIKDATPTTRRATTTSGVRYAEREAITVAERQWVVIIVPPRTSRASLVALARDLHDARPWTRFMIFDVDDMARIRVYTDKGWLRQHQVGRVNDMLGEGWCLSGYEGDVIARFE